MTTTQTASRCQRPGPPGLNRAERRLRHYLTYLAAGIDDARPGASCQTYGDVSDAVPEGGWKWPRYTGLGAALDRVNVYEHEHGRPMLSALVVLKDVSPLQPGAGFAPCARRLGAVIADGGERDAWLAELARLAAYWA